MSSLHHSNYDKAPSVRVPSEFLGDCMRGWEQISARLVASMAKRDRLIVTVECYPGVHDGDIAAALATSLRASLDVRSASAFKSTDEIEALVAPDLGGDDPLFGRITHLMLEGFFDAKKVRHLRQAIADASDTILITGPGASIIAPNSDILIYADMPRWEGQLRQRRGEVDNLGTANRGLKPSLQYKRSFFIDWRVADRLKQSTMNHWDFLLDTTAPSDPKMITGAALRGGLEHCTTRPFRVVPFFDPGPWGGQWMRRVCDLPDGPPNYAWCFDCVPEENSLLLEFADHVTVEIPAINLVFYQPSRLLGRPVYERFGAEFPIRFDFLDTMGGGNLSLQVHPTAAYAREHFGLSYTQDESYYLLDAEPGAEVFLGSRIGIDPEAMMGALEAAQAGGNSFPDEGFVARFPAKKHDHFLIPAGTLHCSGAGSMVLEISATPYIFTFKLWDWNRLGLDGTPRPLDIARGRAVIDWTRDEHYAQAQLVNQFAEMSRGADWREERTGLHATQFIETRRHWFTGAAPHDTGGEVHGTMQVLNLVEGRAAWVESPDQTFVPFKVHYAETFIVPAAVGRYTIRPAEESGASECATLKAFVRKN